MSVDSYPYKPKNYKQTPTHVTDTNLIAKLIVYGLLPKKPAMNIETTFSQRIEASRHLLPSPLGEGLEDCFGKKRLFRQMRRQETE